MVCRFGLFVSLLSLAILGSPMQSRADDWVAQPYSVVLGGIQESAYGGGSFSHSNVTPHTQTQCSTSGYASSTVKYQRIFGYAGPQNPYPEFFLCFSAHITGTVNAGSSDAHVFSATDFSHLADFSNYDFTLQQDATSSYDISKSPPNDPWIIRCLTTSRTWYEYIRVRATSNVSFENPAGSCSSSADGTVDLCPG